MKSVFVVSALFVSSVGMAAVPAYQIDTHVSLDGKSVSDAKFMTFADESAESTQTNARGEVSVKVTPSEFSDAKIKNAVKMAFEITVVKNGKVTKYTPQVITQAGSTAKVEVGGDEGKLNLSVVAEKY